MWPVGFVPEKIWVEPGWQAILAFKLANKWIDYKVSKELEDSKINKKILAKKVLLK